LKNFIIIANPNSGSYLGLNKIKLLQNYITSAKCNADYYLTEGPGAAYSYLKENIDKYTDVIAAGGDGLINEISGLAQYQNFNLGLIPCGTANVLAKEFKIPEKKILKAADIILGENKTILDVWSANDRPFLLFISGGLDSRAVENINLGLKKKIGKLSYVYSFLKEFIFYKINYCKIQHDTGTVATGQFFISNIGKYAGDYIINPYAKYSDGKIELVYFKNPQKIKYISFVINLLLKKNIAKLDFIDIVSSEYFKISCDMAMPVQFDGENGLHTPITVKKLSGKILLAVP